MARYKVSGASPSEIGVALGVAYLLEGSVRRSGDRVRITTTLLKAADGFQIWSEDADARLGDIFAVQERIAAHMVEALALKLIPAERSALANWGTRNAAAYDEYLKGSALLDANGDRKQTEAAVVHFTKALALDPQFATTLAGRAYAESQLYRNSDSDPKRLEQGETWAKKALAIDPRLPRARMALVFIAAARFDYAAAAAQLESCSHVAGTGYTAPGPCPLLYAGRWRPKLTKATHWTGRNSAARTTNASTSWC